MRSIWVILLAVTALVFTTRLSVGTPSKPKGRPPQVKVDRAPEFPVEIADGFGRNASDARERALARAQDKIREMLEKRFALVDWVPPADRLDPEFLARLGVIESAGEP